MANTPTAAAFLPLTPDVGCARVRPGLGRALEIVTACSSQDAAIPEMETANESDLLMDPDRALQA